MSEQAQRPSDWKDPLVRKLLFVGGLAVLLLLPIEWIRGLIAERQTRHTAVKAELASTWGGQQTLLGPVLAVPYQEHWKTKDGEPETRIGWAYVLPERLRIEGTVVPEVRARGIFALILYRATLRMSGTFAQPDLSAWKIAPEDVLWDEAALSVGIPDLRGVAKEPRLAWDDQELGFQPGAGDVDLFCAGMHVALPGLRPGERALHSFSFELTLAGSEALSFVPAGKETEVSLASTWRDPSFTGAFLPGERSVDERGFRATWKVSYFARPWPQRWRRGESLAATLQKQTEASAFGLKLLDPVDFYRQSDRAVKYAALFVLLTFLTVALFEVLQPLRVHPVQYLLVGFAMCLFYLILLAASEQVGFALAYAAGTSATIALVAGYATKVLRSRRRGSVMGALLAGLYGYLYVLLQLEDYALLLGTVGLFAVLATVMWVTRDLDWYAVELGGARTPDVTPRP